MNNFLSQMIEIVMSLLQTVNGVVAGLGQGGLGAGGNGLTAQILEKMLLSPESRAAMRELGLEKGTGPERAMGVQGSGVSRLSEKEWKYWRENIGNRLDKELEKAGMDKGSRDLFKSRSGNLAFQMDRIIQKYPDPVQRNMELDKLVQREVKNSVTVMRLQQEKGLPVEMVPEREKGLASLTGGMQDAPAYFNGLQATAAVPVWVPDTALERLDTSKAEMERMHTLQMEMVEKSAKDAHAAMNIRDIEEGVKRGVFTADDLLKRSTDLSAQGDMRLLHQMGLTERYNDYRMHRLLNDHTAADRIWAEMRNGVTEYMHTVRGTDVLALEQVTGQTTGVRMGFGL